jgi:hypothetical protein
MEPGGSAGPELRTFLLGTRRYSYTYEHSPIKYMYIHPTSINTFERLGRVYLEIHEVSHQERFTVNRGVAYH